MRRANHFIVVLILVIIATFGLRYLFGTMFHLPYGPTGQEDMGALSIMGFVMPAPASVQAVAIDLMFNAHYWMISFLFSLIMVFMLYSVVVFRRKPGDDTDAAHMHGNTALEIAWTVVPVVIVLGFGVYGAVVLNQITTPTNDEMVVNITAFQWGWSFEYPEYEITGGELVLPVDQPMRFDMQSTDVLHAFWVPEFRVKQDLVPGRTTTLLLTATDEGEYRLRCAEICGSGHAAMLAPVRVLSRGQFDAWVEERQNTVPLAELTPEERGEIWYAEGLLPSCAGCHSLDGSAGAGPTWQGLYLNERPLADGTTVIADEEYIRNSIINPNDQIVEGYNEGVMFAGYAEVIAEAEANVLTTEGIEIDIIDDIIAFIKTLEE